MNNLVGPDTSLPESAPGGFSSFLGSLFTSAAFVFKLAAHSSIGASRCFVDQSNSGTQLAENSPSSSTQVREMSPGVQASLESIWDSAHAEIIEDGMWNAVTRRLPNLMAYHSDVVIPALISAIEAGRLTPTVAAEVLKELGRTRVADSHSNRRWAIERGLTAESPVIRDGAGLGLARMGDPRSLPMLRRALANELNAETKADLQLVVDELEG